MAPRVTEAGTILGTFNYMAPEQLEARGADPRSDIFALGAVLFEMATGRKAFDGTSRAAVISSILKEDPPRVSTIQPQTPPELDRVVSACLAKNPDDRWQSATRCRQGAAVDCRGTWRRCRSSVRSPPQPTRAPGVGCRGGSRRSRRRHRLRSSQRAAGGRVDTLRNPASVRPELLRIRTALSGREAPAPLALGRGTASLGCSALARHARNAASARNRGHERRVLVSRQPRNRFLFGWQAQARQRGRRPCPDDLRERRARFPAPGAAWARSSSRKSSAVPSLPFPPREARLIRRRHSTGRGATSPTSIPSSSPTAGTSSSWRATSISTRRPLCSPQSIRRRSAGSSMQIPPPCWPNPAISCFARDDAVFAWRFDPSRLDLVGDPVPAFQQVHCLSADNFLGLSAAGNRVAYLSWSLHRRLVWVDRTGREVGTLGEVGGYTDVRISPDGRKVAVSVRDPDRGQNLDVWVLDASSGMGTRITSERTDEFEPAWFPGGERLVYVSDRFGFYDLFARPAIGGRETILARSNHDKVAPTVSPDGAKLLVSVPEGDRYARVLIPLLGQSDTRPLSDDSRFSEEHAESHRTVAGARSIRMSRAGGKSMCSPCRMGRSARSR